MLKGIVLAYRASQRMDFLINDCPEIYNKIIDICKSDGSLMEKTKQMFIFFKEKGPEILTKLNPKIPGVDKVVGKFSKTVGFAKVEKKVVEMVEKSGVGRRG